MLRDSGRRVNRSRSTFAYLTKIAYLSVLARLLLVLITVSSGGDPPIMFKQPLVAGLSSVLALSLAAPTLAVAQDDEEIPFFIEEIITTATKREQTLQDTPVAVSVVAADP